jgi:hypothetical protein
MQNFLHWYLLTPCEDPQARDNAVRIRKSKTRERKIVVFGSWIDQEIIINLYSFPFVYKGQQCHIWKDCFGRKKITLIISPTIKFAKSLCKKQKQNFHKT